MARNREKVSVSGMFLLLLVIANAVILSVGLTVNERWYWALCLSVPLLLAAILHMVLEKQDV